MKYKMNNRCSCLCFYYKKSIFRKFCICVYLCTCIVYTVYISTLLSCYDSYVYKFLLLKIKFHSSLALIFDTIYKKIFQLTENAVWMKSVFFEMDSKWFFFFAMFSLNEYDQ